MMFSVGNKVRWTSQSQGFVKEKIGVVAEVVPAKYRPDRTRFPKLYKGAGAGSSRDHESYVVIVGTKPYWPRVDNLEKIDDHKASKDALVADTYRKAAYTVEPILARILTAAIRLQGLGLEDDIKEGLAALRAAMKYDRSVGIPK